MTIEELINNVVKGDTIGAGKAFDTVIAQKMEAAFDAKKIEIASKIGEPTEVEVTAEEE
jgi:hypothetical protein